MQLLKLFKVANGDGSKEKLVYTTTEQRAIQIVKESYDFETYDSYEDYCIDDPDTFQNEEEFEQWNYSAFYEDFPIDFISITEIELKEGIIYEYIPVTD